MSAQPYDALLILSYGGPERPEDVIPFLDNALRRKIVPDEQKEELAQHYLKLGGVSPLNSAIHDLAKALEKELKARHIDLPIYVASRNWKPSVVDAMRQMQAAGVKRFLVFVPSGFSSYATCRQYLEDLKQAREEIGAGAPEFDKLRVFYNHPSFIEAVIARWKEAVAQVPKKQRTMMFTLFTAQSLPLSMARRCDYASQLMIACRLITGICNIARWHLTYQSRIGATHFLYLEPEINDVLFQLHGRDVQDVVVVPLGYSCDYMEVLYDLDIDAKSICDEVDIKMVRAQTVGSHPIFVSMIRELIEERLDPSLPKRALGEKGPYHDDCAPTCCRSGKE